MIKTMLISNADSITKPRQLPSNPPVEGVSGDLTTLIDRAEDFNTRFEQEEQQRKNHLLRLLCLIALCLQVVITLFSTIAPLLLAGQINWDFSACSSLVATLGYALIYWWLRSRNYYLSSWLLVGLSWNYTAANALEFNLGWPLALGFMLPLGFAITLLNLRDTLIVAIACICFSFGLNIWREWHSDAITPMSFDRQIVITYVDVVIMPVLISLLVIPQRSHLKVLQKQNDILYSTLQALQQSEHRLRTVVTNAPIILFAFDSKGAFTLLEGQALKALNISAAPLLGRCIFELNHELPELAQAVQAALLGESVSTVIQLKGLDFETWFTPLYDQQNRITGLSGVATNITERKKAEAEIRQTLERERELNELKSRFITTVSHEFRTPLTVILSSADLLEHYADKIPVEKHKTYLHRIKAKVSHITLILNDVLVINKARADKLEFNPGPVDLIKFCQKMVEEAQLDREELAVTVDDSVKNERPTIRFHYKGAGSNPPAQLDEKLLGYILNNLLSNALKYSPQSAGSIVDFTLNCEEEDRVSFEVKDEGIGIPLVDQPKLFEAFHRGSNVGTILGTGLGMSIVKKSVELHDGTLSFQSEEKIGTTFTVTLPLNRI